MGIKEKFDFFGKKNDQKINLPEDNNSESATDNSDDEPNYIKKDDKEDLTKKESSTVAANIINELKSVIGSIVKNLEGVRPQGFQQRNLDKEKGGVEEEASIEKDGANAPNEGEEYIDSNGKKTKRKREVEDVWDKRPQEIQSMIKKTQDLNNASTSSREQSAIGTGKRIKNLIKDHAGDAKHVSGKKQGLQMPKESFLQRIQNRKEAAQDGHVSSTGGFYQDHYLNEGNNNDGGHER